jgi:5-formyltetrahydrofolate cyclo-ligase
MGLISIETQKHRLRQVLRKLRRAIPIDAREAAAEALADADIEVFLPPPGGVIAGYAPLSDEIDPGRLLSRLEACSFRIALPRMEGARLAFCRHRSGDALKRHAFGVLEPLPDAPILRPDLILVPLLGFDARGNRLGYGKGYYDRAAAEFPEAFRLGLAFAAQQVRRLPQNAQDRPLDAVLTERGLVVFSRAAM